MSACHAPPDFSFYDFYDKSVQDMAQSKTAATPGQVEILFRNLPGDVGIAEIISTMCNEFAVFLSERWALLGR